jgi:hypothetical protein
MWPKKLKKVSVSGEKLLKLIHWSRRYVDMRLTWVPNEFNEIYDEIMEQYPFLSEHEFRDETLFENGKHFPYATNGDFEETTKKIQSRCS